MATKSEHPLGEAEYWSVFGDDNDIVTAREASAILTADAHPAELERAGLRILPRALRSIITLHGQIDQLQKAARMDDYRARAKAQIESGLSAETLDLDSEILGEPVRPVSETLSAFSVIKDKFWPEKTGK
jgi:hypothetical protein